MNLKKPRTTAIAIGLILFGFLPLSYGIILVSTADQSEEITIDGNVFTLDTLTSVNILPDFETKENAVFERIKVNFDTLVIFEGDEVGITATATGVKPVVKAIALIITKPSENLEKLFPEHIGKEIEASKEFRQVIELVPNSNPPFQSRVMIPFLDPNQEVMIFGVILRDDIGLEGLRSNEIITIVHPKTDKLQAETNKALLKQVEETKKQIIEQEETNAIFLGLTWIGVSAFPLWFGGEMVLRIYLTEENDKNEK